MPHSTTGSASNKVVAFRNTPYYDIPTVEMGSTGRQEMTSQIEIGSKVEAGQGEDYDTGTVQALEGDKALVAWGTQVKTWTPVTDLRVQD
jgi:hypothetical protein